MSDQLATILTPVNPIMQAGVGDPEASRHYPTIAMVASLCATPAESGRYGIYANAESFYTFRQQPASQGALTCGPS